MPLLLFSGVYFKDYKPDFNYKENILYVQGHKGKNNWTCVADLKNNKLWVEIQYPDWGGQ